MNQKRQVEGSACQRRVHCSQPSKCSHGSCWPWDLLKAMTLLGGRLSPSAYTQNCLTKAPVPTVPCWPTPGPPNPPAGTGLACAIPCPSCPRQGINAGLHSATVLLLGSSCTMPFTAPCFPPAQRAAHCLNLVEPGVEDIVMGAPHIVYLQPTQDREVRLSVDVSQRVPSARPVQQEAG